MTALIKLSCPNCGKAFFNSPEAKYRPFCSERCKLVDLGDWINETHRIPVDDSDGEPPV